TDLISTKRSVVGAFKSANSRLPVPSATGKTISRYSSTRSCSARNCTSLALPATRLSPARLSLSRLIWLTTSFRITVEFALVAAAERERPTVVFEPFTATGRLDDAIEGDELCDYYFAHVLLSFFRGLLTRRTKASEIDIPA